MNQPPAVPPAQPGHASKLRRKPPRWLRRCGWTALVLVTLVVAGGVIVTRPFVLTPLLSWQLSSALGVDVSMDRAEWSWGGRVDLIGVRLDLVATPATVDPGAVHADGEQPAGPDRAFDRLIDAERIAVSLSPGGWWRGRGVLDSIVIEGPVLRVVEDAATGRVNLRQWLAAGVPDEPKPDDAGGDVPALPREVQLRNGRIVVEHRDAGGDTRTLADLPIAGSFEPIADRPGTQRFVLEQVAAAAAVGTARDAPLRIEGTIARDPARIELRVADFDVSQPLGVLAPQRFRAFWAELDPSGALPTLRAVFEPPAETSTQGGRGVRLVQAELVLRGLEFSVPLTTLGLDTALPQEVITPRGAPPDDPTHPHDLRMTEVNGRFMLADDAITVEGLSGLIEGVRYSVKGTAGTTGRERTQLHVETEPFELAADPPFILRMPRMVRNLYGEYRPSGTFRALAIIEHTPGTPVRISGAVELLGAAARYHQFTYPLQDITGIITFDENGLQLENLRAVGPTGARVHIFGQVTNPGEQAKADVTIELANIPIDEHLYGALNAKAQRAIEMFIDEQTLAEYVELGLVAAPGDATSTAYGFDLNNRGRGVVRIVRDLSVAPRSQVTTRIEAEGLRALFEFFPYPLEVVGGALVISPERIGVESLELRGPAGVSATAVGELRREPGEDFVPNLVVQDLVVPVTDNAYLLAALPEVAREWFESFVLTGEAQGRVRVTGNPEATGPDDTVAWRVEGVLADGTARPYGGAFLIRELSGGFAVDRERTELIGMSGQRDTAVLNVSATIEHVDEAADAAAEPSIALSAGATNLTIEPDVIDLVPPDLPARETVAEFFETFDPAGTTDIDLRLTLPPATAGETGVELFLRPKQVAMTNQGVRARAERMQGRITVFDDHVVFDALRGALPATDGGGFVALDGVLGLDETADTALSFRGRTLPRSPVVRATLPEGANAAIEALEIGGAVTIEPSRFVSRARPGEGPAIELDATTLLAGNTANLGVSVTELNGTLQTAVRMYDDGRPTRLDLTLSAPSLRVSERRVDRVKAELNNHADPDKLSIEALSGQVYGGTVSGFGEVWLDDTGAYAIKVTAHDAALGPVIDPTTEPQPNNRPAGDLEIQRDMGTGLVSAGLELSVDPARAEPRVGLGSITVRDAKLFEQRNSVAVLRALNFALPSRQPLTDAEIDFRIAGDTVDFRQILIEGQGLSVKGHGTMDWPTTELDLLFTTRNADMPRLAIVSDLLNMLKDELVRISVRGTLEEPRASLTTLPGTRKAVEDTIKP